MTGLSEITLHRMAKRGEGPPCAAIGRRVVYDLDAVERYVTERFRAAGFPVEEMKATDTTPPEL